MATKTERITILATPEFKASLSSQAASESISISELVRLRCEHPQQALSKDQDELALAEILDTLEHSLGKAEASLSKGMADAEAMLNDLRVARTTGLGAKRGQVQQ